MNQGNFNMNYNNYNNYNNTASAGFDEEEDYDNEPPLLEELGENKRKEEEKRDCLRLPRVHK